MSTAAITRAIGEVRPLLAQRGYARASAGLPRRVIEHLCAGG